jgi:hypothetical protein
MRGKQMSTRAAKSAAGKAIYQLIIEAQNEDMRDRRSEVRFPLFRPVSLRPGDGHVYTAFSREISASGVGLIHNFPLEQCETELTIASEQGYSVKVRAKIVWCRACGEGWYVSGAQFAGHAIVQA